MLIDKPAGWTSHDVVAVVRRELGTRGVGHAGTLDPFATGLLVVLVGKATRLARFVEGRAKRYDAVVRFGVATDTDDATGRVIAERSPTEWPDAEAMQRALDAFGNGYLQRPPAFSAKHVAGTRSYALARRGEAVALEPVAVQVHRLAVIEWQPPVLRLEAIVGPGTYIRALARDLGERLGIPAHCAELRRMSIGEFDVRNAVSIERLTVEALLPLAALVHDLPSQSLDAEGLREVSFGRSVAQLEPRHGRGALLADDGRLVAVAEGRSGRWHPVVVMEPAA